MLGRTKWTQILILIMRSEVQPLLYAQIFTHMRQCECVPNTRKSAATRASFHFRLKSGTDKTQAFPRTFILDVQIFDHERTQICNVK